MSLDMQVVLGVAISLGLVVVMVRQRGVYRAYQTAQQQVIDRQADALALQRELLETQKEMVSLLRIIASPERR